MIKKIILICFLIFNISTYAINDENQKLNQERILNARLQKELQKLLKDQSQLQNELFQNEQKINSLNKEIYLLEEKIKENEETLDQFKKEKENLLDKKKKQEKFIGYQLKIIYQQEKDPLKLLFNQKDISKIERNLTYNEYINKAQTQILEDFKLTIKKINNLEIKISQKLEEMTDNKINLNENLLRTNKIKEQKNRILAQIKREQKTKRQQIENSRKEQEKLEQLIALIETDFREQELLKQINKDNKDKTIVETDNMIDSYSYLHNSQIHQLSQDDFSKTSKNNKIKDKIQNDDLSNLKNNFIDSKGFLPWPLKGEVVSTFGQARFNDERAKLDGILIEAKEGSTIKSIYSGKVLFSQFLQGSGLLIILDHGSGYMSLYGYNDTLLKDVGDIVNAGDVIAIAGNSGSYDKTALYFSIRSSGKPIDPQTWLKKI